MARDKYHNLVRKALEEEGWKITNDPLTFKIGNIQVQMDLGAEQIVAAEKKGEKIAIEIKTFSGFSFITSLYEAIGKYIIYRNVLEMSEKERKLFLAVPLTTYTRFFEEPVLVKVMDKEDVKLIIYDEKNNKIEQWIK